MLNGYILTSGNAPDPVTTWLNKTYAAPGQNGIAIVDGIPLGKDPGTGEISVKARITNSAASPIVLTPLLTDPNGGATSAAKVPVWGTPLAGSFGSGGPGDGTYFADNTTAKGFMLCCTLTLTSGPGTDVVSVELGGYDGGNTFEIGTVFTHAGGASIQFCAVVYPGSLSGALGANTTVHEFAVGRNFTLFFRTTGGADVYSYQAQLTFLP